MLKKFLILLAGAVCFGLAAAEQTVTQTLPQKGYVTIASGDYTVTFMANSNYRISGFAYQNKELFLSRGAVSGTNITPGKETLISAVVKVDDKIPAKVTYSAIKGNKVELQREALFGDVRLSVKYTLTPAGLTWSIKYKLASANKKPNYFYLYTMAWNTKFTEYMYSKKGVEKSGKMTNSGKWMICDDMDYMALYDPSRKVAAISKCITPVPGEMRKNAIWDHKAYHKYFMMHKRPAWKADYESPEYIMFFSAVNAEAADWKNAVNSAVKK